MSPAILSLHRTLVPNLKLEPLQFFDPICETRFATAAWGFEQVLRKPIEFTEMHAEKGTGKPSVPARNIRCVVSIFRTSIETKFFLSL